MRRLLLILSITALVTACAPMSQGHWSAPTQTDVNRPKDDLECQAIASQAAAGAGGWTSVAPMRDAIYQQARQNYYAQCVQSRGYQWVEPR